MVSFGSFVCVKLCSMMKHCVALVVAMLVMCTQANELLGAVKDAFQVATSWKLEHSVGDRTAYGSFQTNVSEAVDGEGTIRLGVMLQRDNDDRSWRYEVTAVPSADGSSVQLNWDLFALQVYNRQTDEFEDDEPMVMEVVRKGKKTRREFPARSRRFVIGQRVSLGLSKSGVVLRGEEITSDNQKLPIVISAYGSGKQSAIALRVLDGDLVVDSQDDSHSTCVDTSERMLLTPHQQEVRSFWQSNLAMLMFAIGFMIFRMYRGYNEAKKKLGAKQQ